MLGRTYRIDREHGVGARSKQTERLYRAPYEERHSRPPRQQSELDLSRREDRLSRKQPPNSGISGILRWISRKEDLHAATDRYDEKIHRGPARVRQRLT